MPTKASGGGPAPEGRSDWQGREILLLKRTLLAPLALLTMVLSATVVHADPPNEANGTLTYDLSTAEVVSTRLAGETLFIDVTIEGSIEGTLSGDIEEAYTVVHHSKTLFNTYRGVLEFEGTVMDAEGVKHEGSLRLLTRGRQDPGLPVPSATPWYMSWVIVDGSGGLEGVQGHGTGTLTVDSLVYAGQVHFSGR